MPWQECRKVDERLRFVARLLDGERMAGLCREFDISRQTGYKIYTRYKHYGLIGLTDRSRRPYRQANRLPRTSVLERAPCVSDFVSRANCTPAADAIRRRLQVISQVPVLDRIP